MQTGRLTRQQLKTRKKNNFGGWMLMQSKTVLDVLKARKDEDEQQQEEEKDPLRLQFMSWFLFFRIRLQTHISINEEDENRTWKVCRETTEQ